MQDSPTQSDTESQMEDISNAELNKNEAKDTEGKLAPVQGLDDLAGLLA